MRQSPAAGPRLLRTPGTTDKINTTLRSAAQIQKHYSFYKQVYNLWTTSFNPLIPSTSFKVSIIYIVHVSRHGYRENTSYYYWPGWDHESWGRVGPIVWTLGPLCSSGVKTSAWHHTSRWKLERWYCHIRTRSQFQSILWQVKWTF